MQPAAAGVDPAEAPSVPFVERLTWDDLATIRSWSDLPFVLKGILSVEDAVLAVDRGVDAIVVSNHGARQLDRTAAPIDMLEEIVDAVAGRAEVWVDGGVRRGLDVAIALGLGAAAEARARSSSVALSCGRSRPVARWASRGPSPSCARSWRSRWPCSARRRRRPSPAPTSPPRPRYPQAHDRPAAGAACAPRRPGR